MTLPIMPIIELVTRRRNSLVGTRAAFAFALYETLGSVLSACVHLPSDRRPREFWDAFVEYWDALCVRRAA